MSEQMDVVEIGAKALYGDEHDLPWNRCPEALRRMWREDFRRALTALDAAGYAVVPKEPTEEMIEAVAAYGGHGGYNSLRGEEFVDAYHDALAAAPKATP